MVDDNRCLKYGPKKMMCGPRNCNYLRARWLLSSIQFEMVADSSNENDRQLGRPSAIDGTLNPSLPWASIKAPIVPVSSRRNGTCRTDAASITASAASLWRRIAPIECAVVPIAPWWNGPRWAEAATIIAATPTTSYAAGAAIVEPAVMPVSTGRDWTGGAYAAVLSLRWGVRYRKHQEHRCSQRGQDGKRLRHCRSHKSSLNGCNDAGRMPGSIDI